MTEPNPDVRAQLHMRWLALSRYDNEGSASPRRRVAGSTEPRSQRQAARPWVHIAVRKLAAPLLPEAADPRDKLIGHKHYIDQHGEVLAEIRNWKWNHPSKRQR